MGFGIIRFDRQRLLEFRDGTFLLSLLRNDNTEVVMRFGKVRIDRQRRLELCHGF